LPEGDDTVVAKPKISLVLSDVDGTLVNGQKALTERAKAAVLRVRQAGIRFAITSGRPPKGMSMLIDALRLDIPTAGFNGGLFVEPDLTVIKQQTLPLEAAREATRLIRAAGLDVWVYRGNDWLVEKAGAPHVAHEAWTVKFEPKIVDDVGDQLDEVSKIVGVSDDLEAVRRCEAEAQARLGEHASAARSQPYYLDVTNRNANKGAVAEFLSKYLDLPLSEIVTIGDQPNDVLMFKRSGFSIAMGNASDQVKAQASAVTDGHDDEGFAKAMERFVLRESS
jgi:Cof subfamily protein (haloacid dehalogenase superfamily)